MYQNYFSDNYLKVVNVFPVERLLQIANLYYWMDYWAEDDTWSTNNDAGKYFSLSQ